MSLPARRHVADYVWHSKDVRIPRLEGNLPHVERYNPPNLGGDGMIAGQLVI